MKTWIFNGHFTRTILLKPQNRILSCDIQKHFCIQLYTNAIYKFTLNFHRDSEKWVAWKCKGGESLCESCWEWEFQEKFLEKFYFNISIRNTRQIAGNWVWKFHKFPSNFLPVKNYFTTWVILIHYTYYVPILSALEIAIYNGNL